MLNSYPDWTSLVRKRLHPLDLPAMEQQEVIAELAAHLEDLYDEQINLGRSESEARERALSEVAQWLPLARKIQRAKQEEIMNARTKRLWLPSLISLTAAMLSLMSFTFFVQPHLHYGHNSVTTLYFPWLAVLPFCGAVGAYLSRRAGGELLARLAASLCPAASMLSIFCFVFLVGVFRADHVLNFSAFTQFTWNWVFLPGSALMLGALPFLGSRAQKTQALV